MKQSSAVLMNAAPPLVLLRSDTFKKTL